MEKQKLNTSIIYILSTLGLVCCCIGGIGIVPAGISYYLAHKKMNEYTANPEDYENGPAMKTAKLIALIVLIINVLYMLFTIYRIYTIGWDTLVERSELMMQQWGVERPQ